MTIRAKVAQYAAIGAVRAPLDDIDAMTLAVEVTPQNHPDQVREAQAAFVELGPQPTEVGAVVAWAKKVEAALARFWDAYEGEVVDGVEIIRRRV